MTDRMTDEPDPLEMALHFAEVQAYQQAIHDGYMEAAKVLVAAREKIGPAYEGLIATVHTNRRSASQALLWATEQRAKYDAEVTA